MTDYIFYIQTWLSPLLGLTVSLCILRYCCKICSKVSDTDSDLDLSNSDHVYVIPNPIHVRDEQDETNSHDDFEFTPPPYELVCPPPSYAESSFKLNISDVGVTPDSSDMPPPPYCPPLPMMSQSSNNRHF
ncbi:hypothetical protein G5714_012818 [Onychostoma macrolepis]|uniref:Uncharacterized protein n=1 Tax=Onychostoma macrolepis TaxID=369639 RepID=A0A7J6CHP0_9TELE|nr:hypothetical protein G5714_012818 [Onychostoma macrolepis]